jgi:hypothetical protein
VYGVKNIWYTAVVKYNSTRSRFAFSFQRTNKEQKAVCEKKKGSFDRNNDKENPGLQSTCIQYTKDNQK